MDEVLTKSQLKKIVGGDGSGCQDWYCYCPGWGGETVTTCSTYEVENMFHIMEERCPGWGGSVCSLL